jgi:hypothetical protein
LGVAVGRKWLMARIASVVYKTNFPETEHSARENNNDRGRGREGKGREGNAEGR